MKKLPSISELPEEEVTLVFNYAMQISALHDERYYNPETVKEARCSPNTCPENIKELLIKFCGDAWKEEMWGTYYDEQFPESP